MGLDWYPLKGLLESALKKQMPDGRYKEGFDMMTSQQYLPIFINLIPGLRGGYEIIEQNISRHGVS